MYGSQMQVMCGAGCAPDYAQALAHWAKVELLKEKVKQRLEKQYGRKLDRIADLIVELVAESAKTAGGLEAKQEELDEAIGGFADGE